MDYMATMNCILTNTEVNFKNGADHIYYQLKFDGNEVDIFICKNCKNKIQLTKPFHIIKGLISNNKWPERSFIVSEECTNSNPPNNSETIILHNFLETADYPKTPKEKLENLFMNLFGKKYLLLFIIFIQ